MLVLTANWSSAINVAFNSNGGYRFNGLKQGEKQPVISNHIVCSERLY